MPKQRSRKRPCFIPNYASDVASDLHEFTYGEPISMSDVRTMELGNSSNAYAQRRRE